MSEIDRIWDELHDMYSRWGISEIPFGESVSIHQESQLHEVFTGRERELRTVLNLFRSRERKRIMVYGWVGIGKTAFILEILGVLKRKAKNTLTAYISLPPEIDLATAALMALASEMEDDAWAQYQLYKMGLRPRKYMEQEPIAQPQFPTQSFEELLKRAFKKYSRVVIAIDDFDKQEPAVARQLLHNAQGMLKGGACFILTGHPSALIRDVLLSERGLFDLGLKLEEMDQPTMYRMLVNYLNSVRPQEARHAHYEPDDPQAQAAVYPFIPETALALCERSGGVPRWLNRLGSYVLLKAHELQADVITPDILQEGFKYVAQQLRGQAGLTPQDYYVLDLVLEKGSLSDATVSLKDLQRVKVKEFSEILPILEKLVQLDLMRRLPIERAIGYEPTPMLSGSQEKPEQDKSSKYHVNIYESEKIAVGSHASAGETLDKSKNS